MAKATAKFGRESKEFTTEPSVDEVGGGMKKGGKAHHKKHMAMGGPSGLAGVIGSPNQGNMGRPGMGRAQRPIVPGRPQLPVMPGRGANPGVAILQKKGGKVHKAAGGKIEHLEKELKHHEHMKAGKAHHGLKKGGGVNFAAGKGEPGGLLGGVYDVRAHSKGKTGDIEGPGYKHGGKAHHKKHMAKGGTLHPKIDVNDKVVEAKQTKSFNTKTGDLEGVGYKHGGKLKKYASGGTVSDSVAKRYENTLVYDGAKMPTKKGGTGSIKQGPAGYKEGGHVAHHTTHGHGDHGHKHHHEHVAKHHAGHSKIEGHPMKHGGKVHTTKMSTHMKKGGKCNY